ncbi:oligosaccharide flippase family protein [Vibrio crassostreae]|uniref:oligosaccharide flippase family protein n=1 Tax=Vibrio crassostreae TaxID=246167 RepID=UPI001404E606|nr:oligosaccharide flippase family protein [Vibrio crassostreae]CAK3667004.1 membrane hypothetical protein [Vibrio crassostreae]
MWSDIRKNLLYLISGNAVASIGGIFLTTLVINIFGLEMLGNLAIAQAAVFTAYGLFNLHTWQALIKFGSSFYESSRWDTFNQYVNFSRFLDVISGVLGFFILNLVIWILYKYEIVPSLLMEIIVTLSFYLLFNLNNSSIGVIRLFGLYKNIAIQANLSVAFKLAFCFVVFSLELSFNWLVVFILISDVIANIYIYVCSRKSITNRFKISRTNDIENSKASIEYRKFFKFCMWLNLSGIIDLPLKQLDVVILSFFLSSNIIGVFKFTKQISKVISQIADPVYQIVYPIFTREVDSSSLDFIKVLNISLSIFFIGVFAFCSVYIFYDWAVVRFFSKDLVDFKYVIISYLFSNVLIVSSICIHPMFIAKGFVKYNAFINLASNSVYLVIIMFTSIYNSLYVAVLAFLTQGLLKIASKIIIIYQHENKKVLN